MSKLRRIKLHDVLANLRDERRFPTMAHILNELRHARRVTLKSQAGKMPPHELAEIARLEDPDLAPWQIPGEMGKADIARQCAWLGLSPKQREAVEAEYDRRYLSPLSPLNSMAAGDYLHTIAAALDYYGKTVDDLARFVPLDEWQDFCQRHDKNPDLFTLPPSLDNRMTMLHGMRLLLGDPDYTEEQLLNDARGSFSIKSFAPPSTRATVTASLERSAGHSRTG